ncbi:MAG: hypothetical protein AVDCRST_MAG18-3874 [uncultured Thermomicrobiales bacterium]|uniref:Uncharacterized protein n=1 Tax=uncultured Thermomicrobiales bacterium TaxID=1645740 RepID=A0A6J4VT73_9BACT|nr:MAG: hypothetical protein AVDCRST_MAG18-3874 [uncultured Thermomicrobiales bacterium]
MNGRGRGVGHSAPLRQGRWVVGGEGAQVEPRDCARDKPCDCAQGTSAPRSVLATNTDERPDNRSSSGWSANSRSSIRYQWAVCRQFPGRLHKLQGLNAA